MALTVKHSKTSAIPDAGDTTLVQPSDWNADHTLTGTVPVANGGTGATTATDGLNALLPSQTSNNGKVLGTDGTNTSWVSVGGTGTVTSVSGTGTVSGISLSGTVTAAGSLTLGGTLDLSSPPVIGGTTPNTITGTTINADTKVVSPDYYAQSILGGNLRTSGGTSLVNWDGGGSGNVTINGGLLANPSNKNVSLAPTGTGSVTVNPATVGAIDNMVIGATTAKAITGTTITGTSFVGSGASLTNVVNSTTAGTGISVSGATGAVTITNTAPDQTVSLTAGSNVTITGTYPSFTIAASGGGGGSPGGANTQVQYNNSGAFGASSSFTWDGTTLKATNLETTGGVLADGAFGGTYVDGIVVDYDTVGASGRISVGGSDSLKFYNGGVAGSLLGSAASNGDWSFTRFVDIGNGTLIGGATNPVLAAAASANNYVQTYIHNDLAGTSASADLVCYPDNGLDTSGWIDMGITSSTYSDATFSVTGPNEGYVFMSALSGSGKTGNFVYATDSTGTSNAHQWYVGGFNQSKSAYKMQLNSTNLTLALPLNSTVTTGTAPFTVASTTQVANLNAATAGTAGNVTGTVAIGNGGTGQTTQTAAFDALSPTTTKGDLIVSDGTDNVRLAVGTNTQVLSADSTAASGLRWVAAGGFSGGTLTSNLTLATGTTSLVPMTFASGTLNTTAAAGALEYDGKAYYSSVATSTRGVMPSEQYVILNTAYTLTSQTAAQKLFNASTNGAVTLPTGTYYFECAYSLTTLSATSGSFGFAMVAGTAVIGSQGWWAWADKAALATASNGLLTYNTAANTTLATANTTTTGQAFIRGHIKITTAGTIIPSVSLGVASAAVVGINSYFKISPVSGTNAANIATGNWS